MFKFNCTVFASSYGGIEHDRYKTVECRVLSLSGARGLHDTAPDMLGSYNAMQRAVTNAGKARVQLRRVLATLGER